MSRVDGVGVADGVRHSAGASVCTLTPVPSPLVEPSVRKVQAQPRRNRVSFGMTVEIARLPERSLLVRYDETPPCDPANATGHRLALGWLRLARRAGECYNRGVKEQQPTNPEQSTPAEADVAVYEGLVSAGLTESEAFRTTHAIRDQAGRNTAEKLETHQCNVNTKLDGFESRLTAKLDGVETKVDRVDTKVDRLRTEVKAEIAIQGAEVMAALKSMERELTIFRWAFVFLIGLLSLLAAVGLANLLKRWFD